MKLFNWLHGTFSKPNWEKLLTPRAKQVLALSRRAAAEQKWKCVEVEHLLAGILRLNQGLAVQMLKNTGLEPSDLRANLERSGVQGTSFVEAIKMPYSPTIKPCLALAWKEAKALGNDYCGTEHILLGILRHGKGISTEILASHALTLERAKILLKAVQEDEAKKSA